MRHAILGNGNLGNALVKELIKNNMEFKIFSTTTGWKYPASDLTKIHDYVPDHVWVTTGAGSVEQSHTDYRPFVDLHIRLPLELAQTLNSSVHLHLFSTDYCSVTPQSLYALSKQHMEDDIIMLQRPKTFIYRVGSLYGTFKPQKCFPYKLKRNYAAGKKITLPPNCVCPTPVDWLAAEILKPLAVGMPFMPCSFPMTVSPKGCTTTKEWGELILGREVEEAPLDTSRPMDCPHFNKANVPTWLELWKEREVDWL